MLIGRLLRFSSHKDEVEDDKNNNDEELMPKTRSHEVASVTDHPTSQLAADSEEKPLTLDDLTVITRDMLMDKNLEVSKVRPFFWTLVEAYVDRFQVFPFDIVKAMFNYAELQNFSAEELRKLVKQIEALYEKQHGKPMRKSTQLVSKNEVLDDEIKELRETLKYAAIVGERLDTK